jgi:hypothetical protein
MEFYTQSVGLSGLCWYLLYGLMNSNISCNGIQPFSDLFHQALYIFWTIIVAVDLTFRARPKIFDRLYQWDVWWILFLWDEFNY